MKQASLTVENYTGCERYIWEVIASSDGTELERRKISLAFHKIIFKRKSYSAIVKSVVEHQICIGVCSACGTGHRSTPCIPCCFRKINYRGIGVINCHICHVLLTRSEGRIDWEMERTARWLFWRRKRYADLVPRILTTSQVSGYLTNDCLRRRKYRTISRDESKRERRERTLNKTKYSNTSTKPVSPDSDRNLHRAAQPSWICPTRWLWREFLSVAVYHRNYIPWLFGGKDSA